MNEMQQLLSMLTDLENEMKRFSGLVKEVMSSITMQEFVPEKANTDMMQCIMELNTKQKECLKLYRQANLGDTAPKKIRIMRDQIEKRKGENRKIDYLESVKKSFLSLYTENKDVEAKLQEFKNKIVTIRVDKYPLEKCLVYIRPFAVFLTMIKSDDPVKAIEQVPVLNDYFGSALVAHITISKDIFIGEDVGDFNMEGDQASDQPKDSTVKQKPSSVQNVESANNKSDATRAASKAGQAAGQPAQATVSVQPGTQPQTAGGAKAAPAGQAAQPTVQPEAANPAPAGQASQPTVQPEGAKAAPAGQASQPTVQPEAANSAPAGQAAQPTVQSEAANPAPAGQASQPTVQSETAKEASAGQASQPEVKAEAAKEASAGQASQPEVKTEAAKEASAGQASQPEVKAEAAKEAPAGQASQPETKSEKTVPEKDAPVAKPKKVSPENKKRSKPKRPKKVDVKALLEEEGFREDKLDDPELKQLQEQTGKKGKKDSKLSLLKGPGAPGAF